MQIQYVSDLHLEIIDENIDFTYIIQKSADILVLAGDIGFITCNTFKKFIDHVCKNWSYIIYVFGNHEFHNIDSTHYSMEFLKILYKQFFKKYHNLKLLDNEVFMLNEHIFIGSTLWSYIPTQYKNKILLNDYSRIYIQGKLFTYDNYIDEFINNYIFLKNAIKYYSKQNKKIIVITHHAPSKFNTCSSKYPKHMYGYGTDIDNILTDNVICWIFGHTHHSCEFILKNTLILSNQFGYIDQNENTQYNTSKFIDLQ